MTTTLNLAEAATLLKIHPKTLERMARVGAVPACKVGRAWVFIAQLLIDHLAALSRANVVAITPLEPSPCPSTDAKTLLTGGSSSRPSEASRSLYSKALGLRTSAKRSKSTTG